MTDTAPHDKTVSVPDHIKTTTTKTVPRPAGAHHGLLRRGPAAADGPGRVRRPERAPAAHVRLVELSEREDGLVWRWMAPSISHLPSIRYTYTHQNSFHRHYYALGEHYNSVVPTGAGTAASEEDGDS